MKKWLGGAMLLLMLLALWPGRAWGVELPVQAEAALLMEKETGQVLYAKNEHQAMEPASVTKVMTLLLVMEAIDSGTLSYDDAVTVSAYAASMGGSQIDHGFRIEQRWSLLFVRFPKCLHTSASPLFSLFLFPF